jgi:alkylation response protein AidB-like acyl-CoA dehydrogenase
VDLSPTPEQKQLRDSLRRLLDRRLAGLVDALPDAPAPDPAQALDDALTVGLLGLGLPEDVGGAGCFADLVVAHEELGHGLAPPLATTLTLAGRLLLHCAQGAEGADRDRLLTDLVAGRLLAAALDGHEADGRSVTTATVDGDSVRVDGHKRRVVNAHDVGELIVVARRPDPGGSVLVRIPIDAPGLDLAPAHVDSDIAHWTVTLRRVAADGDMMLGPITEPALVRFRNDAMVLAAARLLGAGRAVVERTITHVQTREQFGRPIGTFQAVQHQLADVATDLDATALAVAQAGWAVEASVTPAETTRLAATALLSANDAARRATLVAHQLHGGMGFVLDSPLHLWSARAIADPTIPLHRRDLLDRLADALGVTETAVALSPDHRVGAAT